MWRNVLAVLLAVAVARAQTEVGGAGAPPSTRTKSTKAWPGKVVVSNEHSALRRGTDEKILLLPALNSSNVPVYIGAARPNNGRFEPMELEIEASPCITVVSVVYPKPRKLPKVLSVSEVGSGRVIDTDRPRIYVKVHADRDLALGDRIIRGKLGFQRISQFGLSNPEALEFNIPVQVVEHDEKVKRDGAYYEDVPLVEKILIIALMPIIWPWAFRDC